MVKFNRLRVQRFYLVTTSLEEASKKNVRITNRVREKKDELRDFACNKSYFLEVSFLKIMKELFESFFYRQSHRPLKKSCALFFLKIR